ncbi:hypothetical protein RBH85_36105 (plasmid) [Streptomyces rochei]|nr:hypothetical protein [Streptomyces rochei]WMI61890.1 hypothetical protein RBH85_36105 [Streptomyces rochei]
MGWSLSRFAPPHPELLDALFLAVGRALHLANAYENKCQYVLRVGNMVTASQADPVLTLDELIASTPVDQMLGGTLHSLANHPMGVTMDMDILHKAREALNFIAHEGASIGYIWYARPESILQHTVKLRTAVGDLAAGDNLISQWCHGLEEPHASQPTEWIATYPDLVDRWVFADLLALLPNPAQEQTDAPDVTAG